MLINLRELLDLCLRGVSLSMLSMQLARFVQAVHPEAAPLLSLLHAALQGLSLIDALARLQTLPNLSNDAEVRQRMQPLL